MAAIRKNTNSLSSPEIGNICQIFVDCIWNSGQFKYLRSTLSRMCLSITNHFQIFNTAISTTLQGICIGNVPSLKFISELRSTIGQHVLRRSLLKYETPIR